MGNFVSQWISRTVQKPWKMYQKGKYDKIDEGLNQVDWKREFENKTLEESWIMYKEKLKQLVEEYVPIAKPRDYNQPWMNEPLMKLFKNKHHAWKRYTETKGYVRYMVYKKEANRFSKLKRQAKRA